MEPEQMIRDRLSKGNAKVLNRNKNSVKTERQSEYVDNHMMIRDHNNTVPLPSPQTTIEPRTVSNSPAPVSTKALGIANGRPSKLAPI